MRPILYALALIACLGLLRDSMAAGRDVAFTGGGGSTDPPLAGPTTAQLTPNNDPVLRTTGPLIVLLTATAERPDRSTARIAVVRFGTEILGVARLHEGVPAVLMVPSVEGLQLDVLGTDALDVPVGSGSVVRVVAP